MKNELDVRKLSWGRERHLEFENTLYQQIEKVVEKQIPNAREATLLPI